MGHYRTVNKITISQFTQKLNIVLWISFFLISIFFLSFRITDYKSNVEKEEAFKEFHSKHFKLYKNYFMYATFGITSIYVPSPTSVFFKNTVVPKNLFGKFDSMEIFSLRNSVINKSVSPGLLGINMDFVFIIAFFLCILGINSGFHAGRSRNFFKFCQKIYPRNWVVFYYFISRLLIFILAYTVFYSAHILLIFLNGITLSDVDLYGLICFFLAGLALIIFFFACGAIIGNKKLRGAITISIMIGVLVFFNAVIPLIISEIIESKLPNNTEEFKVDLKQFVTLRQYESDAEKKYGKFNKEKLDSARKAMEYYFEDVYPRMEALEKQLYDKTANAAKWFRNLSIFTPGSFFLMTGSEVSSLGYGNLLGFYSHQIKLKKGFVRFYIDRTVYNDPKIIVNYIKSDENIYRAQTMVPDNFWWGFAINMFWGAILFFIAVRMTNRRLNASILKDKEIKDITLELHYGKHMTIISGKRDFIFYLMDVLDGNARPGAGEISIEGKPVERGQTFDYIYIPSSTLLPDDIKTGTLLAVIGKFAGLSSEGFDKVKSTIDQKYLDKYIKDVSTDHLVGLMMALAAASEKKIIIFDNIACKVTEKYELMMAAKELIDNGKLIIDYLDGMDQSTWGQLDEHRIFPYEDGMFVNGSAKLKALFSVLESKS